MYGLNLGWTIGPDQGLLVLLLGVLLLLVVLLLIVLLLARGHVDRQLHLHGLRRVAGLCTSIGMPACNLWRWQEEGSMLALRQSPTAYQGPAGSRDGCPSPP